MEENWTLSFDAPIEVEEEKKKQCVCNLAYEKKVTSKLFNYFSQYTKINRKVAKQQYWDISLIFQWDVKRRNYDYYNYSWRVLERKRKYVKLTYVLGYWGILRVKTFGEDEKIQLYHTSSKYEFLEKWFFNNIS